MDAATQANHEWQAQYEFWNKIITDEVARRRFNDGFEPLDCDLYRDPTAKYPIWLGRVRICQRDFRVKAAESFDPHGKKILKLEIRAQER